VNRFSSGPQPHYYGKGDVIAYRLNRDGRTTGDASPVFGANVLMLVHGASFWPTYTTGDNSALIATDSMKNFIQRETMNFAGYDLESYCRFLADRFLHRYDQVEGIQVSADEIPYRRLGGAAAFVPHGPERAYARVERDRSRLIETASGFKGFKLLRLGGSSFTGFVRDEYTTLSDMSNRPLHMWLDLEWGYIRPEAAFAEGSVSSRVRTIVHDVFASFESGSIQQVIHRIGSKVLQDVDSIAEVRLEASNRTWDTIAEQGETLGVYTDPRPPYGCLGLTLKR
jgi:urate oxidase / 2-oxo-4-hydroxy-4-carboxy-5-ureidoimidazoline decarboxylase